MCQELASRKAYCDYALMVGASTNNAASIAKLAGQAAGLKMYLNDTFTTLRMDSVSDWSKHFDAWPRNAPLCVHAEGRTTAAAILIAALHDRPLHVCHVARREEIEVIRAAKAKGLPITCEVAPHHLFLCECVGRVIRRDAVDHVQIVPERLLVITRNKDGPHLALLGP